MFIYLIQKAYSRYICLSFICLPNEQVVILEVKNKNGVIYWIEFGEK